MPLSAAASISLTGNTAADASFLIGQHNWIPPEQYMTSPLGDVGNIYISGQNVNSTGSFGRLLRQMIAVDIFHQLQNL